MFVVDTSVWVDFLRGTDATQVRVLKALLDDEAVVGIAPIILQEVLQGADSEQRVEKWRKYFSDLWLYISKRPLESHVAAGSFITWKPLPLRTGSDWTCRAWRLSAATA